MKKVKWLIIFMFLIEILFAHQDKIIKIKDNKLVGLPTKYFPNKINIDELKIEINNLPLKFPLWFSKYSSYLSIYKLKILASWHHDLTLDPPYIVFIFEKIDGDFAYNFTFNLETKELLHISVSLKLDEDSIIKHKLDSEYN